MNQAQTDNQFPDDAGLLWSYRLDGQGGGQFQGRHGGDHGEDAGFNWFHLRSDEPATHAWMQEMELDSHVIEALTALETRPRMIPLANGVLINLRGVNTNPNADPEDMISIRIWFNQNTIVSTRPRNRKLLSVEDVRKRIEAGTGPSNPGEFVTQLTEHLANRIGDVVDHID